MSDDKTKVSEPVEAADVDSPTPKGPKQTSAKSAGAKPAKATIAHDAVVGAGDTDPIRYSSAKPSQNHKVLTVLHIQRRLVQEGFHEAEASGGGDYDIHTQRSVSQYQESIGAEPTGVLTRDQFAELFAEDPNVTVDIDTHFDHTI